MSRYLLLLILAAWFIPAQSSDARERRFAKWLRGARASTPSPSRMVVPPTSEPTLFGMGIGVGSYPPYDYPRPGQFNPYRFDSYIYDPYQSGSFEAPDLLNDPYFRERHRYDSRFPGRRSRQR